MRRARKGLAAIAIGLGFFAIPVVEPLAPPSSVLLDREGRLLSATVAADEQWRFPDEGELPPKYVAAVERFEDRRFRWHPGVDPVAIARAVRSNYLAGTVVSGGSTITMQVVRLSRHNPPRTLPEKALEALLAVRLEAARSKDEILVSYAENAPFGGNTVGLSAAAWRYFGRAPADLSWAESATLAVLPNSPAMVHPGRGRAELRRKRNGLLIALRDHGTLTPLDCDAALAEPLPDAPLRLSQEALPLLARARGERAWTTLDGAVQARVQDLVDRHAAEWAGNGVHNAAALVAEVGSGEVLAWVGNVRARGGAAHGEHVDMVTAPRSTGSLLKPFLYAAMLEDGELSPHQLVPDIPTRFGGFAPENFDRSYDGAIPASEALARSRNVPAVWMLRDYTVDRFARRLRGLGLTTLFRPAADYGLALIVGGAEGTLWDLVGAYRDLALSAQHGEGPLPGPLHWRKGEATAPRAAPFDAGAAWLTIQALVEVNRPGADVSWRAFAGAESVAWKTGTSFGFRDGWAIGFTADHVVGVWVGNADGEGRPGLTGTRAAAPLMFNVFDALRGEGGGFVRPDAQLATVDVCADSGMLAGPDCAHVRTERTTRAGVRAPVCAYCTRVHTTADGSERIDASCSATTEITTSSRFVLPAGMESYYIRSHAEYRPLPPAREGCVGELSSPMAVLTPSPDASVYVPVELDGKGGRVVFTATHRDPDAQIFWHLDEAFVATTTAPHELSLDPSPGPHRLTLVDAAGAKAVRRFSVIDDGRGG